MAYKKNLQRLLVQKLNISNKEAKGIIEANRVEVNGETTNENKKLEEKDLVIFDGKTVLKEAQKSIYLALYKPRGIECTLNPNIHNNLLALTTVNEKVFPVGRLDKESEGLLILTNDGNFFNQTINPTNKIEKEYDVKVDKIITEDFIKNMMDGVEVLGKKTLPCKVFKTNDFEFKIILTQGLNRQIRRMCYKLNYMVLSLKRVRIGGVELNNLLPGEQREILEEELILKQQN